MVGSPVFDFNKNKKPQQGFSGYSYTPMESSFGMTIGGSGERVAKGKEESEKMISESSPFYKSPFTDETKDEWTWKDGKLTRKSSLQNMERQSQSKPSIAGYSLSDMYRNYRSI